MGRSFFRKNITQRRNDRCARCGIRKELCFCQLIPSIQVSTQLRVVMHVAERNLTSNSARLAVESLPGSQIHWRGGHPAQVGDVPALQAVEGALVLFPSEDAAILTSEFVATLKRPVTLWVPDGSWKQARKMAHREPALQTAISVKLSPGPPSEYRLRAEPHPYQLSTFEAIARAMGVLEGPAVQQELEIFFRIMVGRHLCARGLIRAADCP
ncbi:tRNA-uridine aminocarboxypropyltransferase [Bdellovibrionota bacterium FG-1]